MKYIRCIPAYKDFLTAMFKAEKYRKPILENRAAGNFPAEREAIRLACLTFVDHLLDEYSCAAKPPVRKRGNRLSGRMETIVIPVRRSRLSGVA